MAAKRLTIANRQSILLIMKNFHQLGVYDLRNYARSVGVASPTSKRKDILILEINQILNGEREIKRSNKGRKTKDVALKFNERGPVLNNSKEIEEKVEEILVLNNELNEKIRQLKESFKNQV